MGKAVMMKVGFLGSVGLWALCASTAALAQDQSASATSADAASSEQAAPGTIIVTARRKAESLQDVPQTVNVVTGSAIEKLNVTQLSEVDTLVPGLTLESGSTGFNFGASLRGVSFSTLTGPANVEFYVNDAAVEQAIVFQSMYDVGQIEVLRGPQGTLRGRASPSGSITVTTRRPDLQTVGGFGYMSATQNQIYLSGAVNVPIISDVAAIRVAGVIDHNDADEVRSINDRRSPYSNTGSFRVGLQVEPTPDITANVTYQYLQNKSQTWPGVESISLSQPDAPRGWGGTRIIRASDRLGVSANPTLLSEKQHLVTGNVDVQLGGAQLSYVGAYLDVDQDTQQASDSGAIFPDRNITVRVRPVTRSTSQELRLSSLDRLFGMLDFTVGGFYYRSRSSIDALSPQVVASSFGAPAGTPGFPMFFAQGDVDVNLIQIAEEKSIFGNVIAHLGERTELSAGLRHIWYKLHNTTLIRSAFGQPLNLTIEDSDKPKATIYNISLKHRFSDDLMAYANTGTSWRRGTVASTFGSRLSPELERFVVQEPETSTSYEVGVKASMFDRRVTIDLAAYHQKFKDFLYISPAPIFYVAENLGDGSQSIATNTFRANVPATVTGVEAAIGFRPNRNLSIDLSASYAKGKIKNGVIPCNPPGGVPNSPADITGPTGGELVFTCRSSQRLSNAPDFSLNLQTEYSAPIWDAGDGFVRGLLQYNGSSPNDPSNRFDTVSDYALLNLYLGLRSPDGNWEVTVFGKNVTNTQRTLVRDDVPFTVGSLQTPQLPAETFRSNYVAASRTRPREFGLSVRYAFGSR